MPAALLLFIFLHVNNFYTFFILLAQFLSFGKLASVIAMSRFWKNHSNHESEFNSREIELFEYEFKFCNKILSQIRRQMPNRWI